MNRHSQEAKVVTCFEDPELARTCCDYADTPLERASTSSARADDRQKARSLLDESLAFSSELGMRLLMERVLSRREILRA